MKNYSPLAERIRFVRNFQPSVLRSSIVMTIIQYTSLIGFFALTYLSIMIFADSEALNKLRDRKKILKQFLYKHKEFEQMFTISNSASFAYLFLVIALLMLLIWKLTTMVRKRNAYILLMNDATTEETE